MKSLYATTTDIHYLVKAFALYRSFAPYLDADTTFAFYCMDRQSAGLLENFGLDHCRVVEAGAFETAALKTARRERAMNEYCWTCKPAILLHAIASQPNLDWAVYLDSDMMVFGNLDIPLIDAGEANVLLTPHRFATPEFMAEQNASGVYNAGYAAFRNSEEGNRALQWWLDRCLELCPNAPVDGIYADQTYLNSIPDLFSGVVPCHHKGLNAAPWNVDGVATTSHGERIYMDDDQLLLYHFQAFQIYGYRLYDMYPGHIKISTALVRHVYEPYASNLRQTFELLGQAMPGFRYGIQYLASNPRLLVNKIKRWVLGLNNLLVV